LTAQDSNTSSYPKINFNKSEHGERRIALVIGNSKYKNSPLKNPENDAKSIAIKLREFDFEVIEIVNQNRIEIYKAIKRFGEKLKQSDVGLFYYAGHGMQVNGENYLIPINSPIESEDEVPYNAINAKEILAKMESARSSVNIVILDACRNNPFPSSFRSNSRGLARIDAPVGTLIVYSTAPGQVAADGDGENGLFTNHLLKQMSKANTDIRDVIMATRADVIEATSGNQVPWESSSLVNKFYFANNPIEQTQTPTQPQSITKNTNTAHNNLVQRASSTSFENELSMWKVIRNSTDPAELNAFINKFSQGVFTQIAIDRLTTLTQQQSTNKALFIDTNPVNANIEFIDENFTYDYGISLPKKTYKIKITAKGYESVEKQINLKTKENFYFTLAKETEAIIETKTITKTAEKNKITINDVSFLMKTIPQGIFMMGSNSRTSQKPRHKVAIKSFMLMETEVTWALYQQCINAGKCDKNISDKGFGKEDHPIINVSWNKVIQQFIPWINNRTGQNFRLPSESEWEYAARAGTTSNFSWGDKIKCSHAKYNGGKRSKCYFKNSSNRYIGTAKVKSYSPNAFGLFDMHGNVAEWLQDCRTKSYSRALTNGLPNFNGDCDKRMVRGGSWLSDSSEIKVSNRDRGTANKSYQEIGFRLAKDI